MMKKADTFGNAANRPGTDGWRIDPHSRDKATLAETQQ